MAPHDDKTPSTLIRSIANREPIKVWSWLTTIFGDMAREPGDEISGMVLGALTERIGIKPEAMRVALHRLRKDGWIVTRRAGRSSHYRLSDHGLAETLRASERIYARQVERPPVWHLVMTDPARSAPVEAHRLPVSAHVFLGEGHGGAGGDDALVVDLAADAVPDWMIRAAIPAEVEAGYRVLSALLSDIEDALTPSAPVGFLDGTVLRLLVLHHWRRALLRHGETLGKLCEGRWTGTDCRTRSHALLDRFGQPSMQRLTDAVAGEI